MLRLVAPVTAQFSVTLLREVTVADDDVKLEIVGAGTTVTFTVAVADVPDKLIAVSVYVVVAVGETATSRPVTLPTPLSIDTEVALIIFQESTVLLPTAIVALETEKLEMIGEVVEMDVERLTLTPQLEIIANVLR
jgi:hypothetical protein